MFGLADQRRAHFQRVLVLPGGADEDAAVTHGIDDGERHRPPHSGGAVGKTDIDAELAQLGPTGYRPLWVRDTLF